MGRYPGHVAGNPCHPPSDNPTCASGKSGKHPGPGKALLPRRRRSWGGITTLITGLTFSLGLVLVVVGGAELLTGNMALVPMAVLEKEVSVLQLVLNFVWLFIGNLAGSLFVAYFLADKTGVIKQGAPAEASTDRPVAARKGSTTR